MDWAKTLVDIRDHTDAGRAVVAMTLVVNPISTIAERIPLPGRRRWPFRDDDEE